MATISFKEVNDDILRPLRPPRYPYLIALAALAAGIMTAATLWIYQVETGMGVAGINIPVGWAVYITNFVFWVGIAHSGTLISAILHLVRSRWRTAVSRSAEAMTIFAVMTAGLFPLVHLGRIWVFYFILPYPSQRQLWPNFISPLVWDVVAVTTYLTVSVVFFYVGLIPDAAAARDRMYQEEGPNSWRTRFYTRLALGWTGAGNQWRNHGRAYLFFAALATPLVVSVHSVVSWDFAMSLLPGWHTTIFAPYFVAGAIHSGLAMVLTLLIPMRKLLHLERLITLDTFDSVAKTMIVTTAIVAYAYAVEPFISWYSGDRFEQQFAYWRATSWFAPFFWSLVLLNVLAPLAFLFRAARRNLTVLFVVSLLVNLGMWLERWVIISGSTAHDFLPHNWGKYRPTYVEIGITIGAFCFFLFWFFGFSRLLPTVALSDVKEEESGESKKDTFIPKGQRAVPYPHGRWTGVLGIFKTKETFLAALRHIRLGHFEKIETFSPMRIHEAEVILGRGASPVRYWTLIGALSGCAGGFALAIGSALVNGLIVGGKHPVSIIPYCIVGFEGTILIGTLSNFVGTIVHARLTSTAVPAIYDRRFSTDQFGIFVACPDDQLEQARSLVASTEPEEVHVHE